MCLLEHQTRLELRNVAQIGSELILGHGGFGGIPDSDWLQSVASASSRNPMQKATTAVRNFNHPHKSLIFP